jgi:hypothetical protein
VKARCECGKEHEIIPCEWLSFIRDREWVPRAKGQERLTDASLARLTRHDTRLAETVTREEHTDFLNLVGINGWNRPCSRRVSLKALSWAEIWPNSPA